MAFLTRLLTLLMLVLSSGAHVSAAQPTGESLNLQLTQSRAELRQRDNLVLRNKVDPRLHAAGIVP